MLINENTLYPRRLDPIYISTHCKILDKTYSTPIKSQILDTDLMNRSIPSCYCVLVHTVIAGLNNLQIEPTFMTEFSFRRE